MTEFTLLRISIEDMRRLATQSRDVYGVPTYIAFGENATAYIWPKPSGNLDDLIPANPESAPPKLPKPVPK